MRTHLKTARLIDGTGARPVDGASVIVEGDANIVGPSGLRDEIKQAADTYRRAKEMGIRMCQQDRSRRTVMKGGELV
jgi:hypothetical protein